MYLHTNPHGSTENVLSMFERRGIVEFSRQKGCVALKATEVGCQPMASKSCDHLWGGGGLLPSGILGTDSRAEGTEKN